ncbi:ACT domain-containing protein, partial [Anoxybacillus geothermalis]|nr:ACT domain-containing protein [Anoxybacillus geothermalis]
MEKKVYLVREDVLPEAMIKVVLAKQLLVRKNAASVAEAAQLAN